MTFSDFIVSIYNRLKFILIINTVSLSLTKIYLYTDDKIVALVQHQYFWFLVVEPFGEESDHLFTFNFAMMFHQSSTTLKVTCGTLIIKIKSSTCACSIVSWVSIYASNELLCGTRYTYRIVIAPFLFPLEQIFFGMIFVTERGWNAPILKVIRGVLDSYRSAPKT